jgi:hypothetical protein
MAEFIHYIAKVLELLSLVFLCGMAFTAGQRAFSTLFPRAPLTITYTAEKQK